MKENNGKMKENAGEMKAITGKVMCEPITLVTSRGTGALVFMSALGFYSTNKHASTAFCTHIIIAR